MTTRNHSAILKQAAALLMALVTSFLPLLLYGQDCDPEVPFFEVDLSGQPDLTYLSPNVVRDGNCCGTTHPDNCIAFEITLHEDAVGILFDICDGAVPPGALFYQIECGPPVAVGEVLCLDGPGPHHLTFCKPGNNQNIYCITSIPPPSAGPPQVASDGCTADIWCTGYDLTSINWTSVTPGSVGAYDDLLSCPTCETTTVTAPEQFPPFVDYMVCGETIGSCATTPDCDTVRVYFEASLAVTIAPEEPVICFGSTGTEVQAIGSGGFPPYTFTWSNGTTGETTWIDAPGTYTVTVTDTSDCPPASFEFTVTEYELPLTVDAGPDIVVCSDNQNVQLNGTYSGLDSCIWEGGNGSFLPNRYDPNAIYSPSVDELENGEVELIIALYPDGDCPPAKDTLMIQFAIFDALVNSVVQNVQCFGDDDGSVSVEVQGDWEPYSIEWDNPALSGWNISDLPPGNYSALAINSVGCSVELEFEIQEPEELAITIDQTSPVSCFGVDDGTADISISGGLPDYSVMWSSPMYSGTSVENLYAGDYTVVVEDSHLCTDSISFSIDEPPNISIEASSDTLVCPGESFSVSAEAFGGSGELTYHWSHDLANAAEGTVQLLEDDTISVFVTDENGCSSETIFLPVEVITMTPDLLLTTPGDPFCLGGSSTVTAQYSGEHPPYSYTWSDGLPSGPGPHTVSPNESTIYEVVVSDICGNEVGGNVEVIVWPLPELALTELNNVQCFGMSNGSATIEVSGGTPGYSLNWSDGIEHSTIAVGLAQGDYSVTVLDSHQCPDSLGFNILEPDPLNISAGSDTSICPGEEIELWAQASGGIGEYTYNWNANLSNDPSHIVNPVVDFDYTVSASDMNACTTDELVIGVDVITLESNLLSVWNDGPVCVGEASSLHAEYNGEYPPYTYNWSGNLPTGAGPHTIYPEDTTTYSVTVIDICDNTISQSVQVNVWPLPEISLPDILGDGCADLLVNFSDTLNDPTHHTFVWTVDDSQFFTGSTFNYNFEEPGTHTVDLTVTSFNGCQTSSESPSLVIVLPSPDAQFSANPWETGIDRPEINFTDQSNGDISSWQWAFGDGETSLNQHPQHVYGDTGTYAVQLLVANEFGCIDSVIHSIIINPVYNIIIPNAFTPTAGNDGYYDPNSTNNDIFYPFADYVEEFRMSIFNRWGELVFESLEFEYGWNGTYRDEPCAQDVYVYKIEFTFSDGVQITRVGDVTLFR